MAPHLLKDQLEEEVIYGTLGGIRQSTILTTAEGRRRRHPSSAPPPPGYASRSSPPRSRPWPPPPARRRRTSHVSEHRRHRTVSLRSPRTECGDYAQVQQQQAPASHLDLHSPPAGETNRRLVHEGVLRFVSPDARHDQEPNMKSTTCTLDSPSVWDNLRFWSSDAYNNFTPESAVATGRGGRYDDGLVGPEVQWRGGWDDQFIKAAMRMGWGAEGYSDGPPASVMGGGEESRQARLELARRAEASSSRDANNHNSVRGTENLLDTILEGRGGRGGGGTLHISTGPVDSMDGDDNTVNLLSPWSEDDNERKGASFGRRDGEDSGLKGRVGGTHGAVRSGKIRRRGNKSEGGTADKKTKKEGAAGKTMADFFPSVAAADKHQSALQAAERGRAFGRPHATAAGEGVRELAGRTTFSKGSTFRALEYRGSGGGGGKPPSSADGSGRVGHGVHGGIVLLSHDGDKLINVAAAVGVAKEEEEGSDSLTCNVADKTRAVGTDGSGGADAGADADSTAAAAAAAAATGAEVTEIQTPRFARYKGGARAATGRKHRTVQLDWRIRQLQQVDQFGQSTSTSEAASDPSRAHNSSTSTKQKRDRTRGSDSESGDKDVEKIEVTAADTAIAAAHARNVAATHAERLKRAARKKEAAAVFAATTAAHAKTEESRLRKINLNVDKMEQLLERLKRQEEELDKAASVAKPDNFGDFSGNTSRSQQRRGADRNISVSMQLTMNAQAIEAAARSELGKTWKPMQKMLDRLAGDYADSDDDSDNSDGEEKRGATGLRAVRRAGGAKRGSIRVKQLGQLFKGLKIKVDDQQQQQLLTIFGIPPGGYIKKGVASQMAVVAPMMKEATRRKPLQIDVTNRPGMLEFARKKMEILRQMFAAFDVECKGEIRTTDIWALLKGAGLAVDPRELRKKFR